MKACLAAAFCLVWQVRNMKARKDKPIFLIKEIIIVIHFRDQNSKKKAHKRILHV